MSGEEESGSREDVLADGKSVGASSSPGTLSATERLKLEFKFGTNPFRDNEDVFNQTRSRRPDNGGSEVCKSLVHNSEVTCESGFFFSGHCVARGRALPAPLVFSES